MPPPFQLDDLPNDEFEQIRRFIGEGDELSEEMHALSRNIGLGSWNTRRCA